MKIVCSKQNLFNGLLIVSRAIPSKPSLSILDCILVDTTKGNITLTGNNIDMGIETVVEGDIIEPGIVALDAKMIVEIVRKLPDSEVTIETGKDYKTTIVCEKAKFNIMGKSGDEYTYLPKVEKESSIVLSQYALKEIVRKTIFSVGENDNNILMRGELFKINGTTLTVIALDGHRVAIRNIELKEAFGDREIIILGKSLNEVMKIISDDTEKEITISFTQKHVVFEFDETVVVSRIIEGEFFKVSKMISSDYETKMIINKRELMDCIERAMLLVKEGDKKPIIFNITDTKVEIMISSSIGSMKEDIDIEKQGKDLMIGFNAKFVLDALRVIEDETVEFFMVNPKSPCFIKKEGEESYTYLVLPVNFSMVN
ncbi:MAG: DNA polymerase III subunit beta [Acetatifactor sp.]|nr:DNA polymerase III subunit beta [Acetatifactor sp.]